jgi:hypothetical protein
LHIIDTVMRISCRGDDPISGLPRLSHRRGVSSAGNGAHATHVFWVCDGIFVPQNLPIVRPFTVPSFRSRPSGVRRRGTRVCGIVVVHFLLYPRSDRRGAREDGNWKGFKKSRTIIYSKKKSRGKMVPFIRVGHPPGVHARRW